MDRSLWRISFVLMTLLVPTLISPGCVRSAQQRAELDLEVGIASLDGTRFEVDNGLAAFHDFEAGRLELWAQAPVLDLAAELDQQAPPEWEITVENVMPDADMIAPGEDVPDFEVVSREHVGPTTITWTVALEPGQTTVMRIAPPDYDQPEAYRVAVLSDIQDEMDEVDRFWRRMNQDDSIRFVISAGDITQFGEWHELEYFMETLEVLEVPFYTTIGNHEIGPASPEGFHELYGRANFHFEFKGVHFTWVDSASATVDPLVYDWLEDWLEQAEDATHVFLTHIPPLDPQGVRNGSFRSRNEAMKLLSMLNQGDVDLGLYGHIHSYYADSHAEIPVYISGGGGALAEKFDGIGQHYLTVDFDPQLNIDQVAVIRMGQD